MSWLRKFSWLLIINKIYIFPAAARLSVTKTVLSLFIEFKKGYSIYYWSAKWYEQNWEENSPIILGLERKALKLVRNLTSLLFVKNQSGCEKQKFHLEYPYGTTGYTVRRLRACWNSNTRTCIKVCTEYIYLKPRIKPSELSI